MESIKNKIYDLDFETVPDMDWSENISIIKELLQQDRTDIYNEILFLFNNCQDIEEIKQEIIKLKELNTTLD